MGNKNEGEDGYTIDSLKRMKAVSTSNKKVLSKFVKKVERLKPGKIDGIFHNAHYEEFERIDCLECANCCSSISPILYMVDIERIASHLKIKSAVLIEKYLYVDDEGDYVFKYTPCPFLGEGNYCDIYDVRPRACREYPHTDRKRIYQILNKTKKNYHYCPAVFNIIESLRDELH